MVVDYSQSKIYYIICNTTGLKYIGSTTKKYLSQRLQGHLADYRCFTSGKHEKQITSYKVLEHNNYEIVLIENFPCATKDELHAKERFHIQSTECVNKKIPTQTRKEYIDANRELVNQRVRTYQLKNKDLIKQKQKREYDANREQYLLKAKMYREANKERIAENTKIYQQQNKTRIAEIKKKHYESIKARQHEKWDCDCGSCVSVANRNEHFKTKKHIKFSNSQIQEGV
jgi:hypothetical protein